MMLNHEIKEFSSRLHNISVLPMTTIIKFGFSAGYFCTAPLLCLQNTLICIEFDVLKCIIKISKVPT